MKKIALFSDGWKRSLTYAWVSGIMKKIHESDEEICLYHYNCYGNWSYDEAYNDGEYNIYQLPDLSEFDGVILACTNITDENRLQKISDFIKKASIPVVNLIAPLDDFYYVGTDNMSSIRELVSHLYHEHACRKFLFAGGPIANAENSIRVKSFKQTLASLHVPETDYAVLYGDYDHDTGVHYMNQLYKSGHAFPDAIVCANDNIAIGICSTAESLGLKVPQDFYVTGFDNLDKATYFLPQITTAVNDREQIAYTAAELLFDIWDGKDVAHNHFIPATCIYRESCGCNRNIGINCREYAKKQVIFDVTQQKYDEDLMELESRMAACTNFSDVFDEYSNFFHKLNCDGFYLVLDKKLFCPDIHTSFSQDGYCLEHMSVECAWEGSNTLQFETISDLFGHLEKQGANHSYMFTPIHFKNQSVGFTILKNGRFLRDYPHFYDIHSTFVNILESLMKHNQIEHMYEKLKYMYNRDALTGLYNRIAYNEFVESKFETYCYNNISCALIFCDVDYFKKINDTKGHKYGDYLLKVIADILKMYCPENGYVYRFGGDEFTVFFPYATLQSVEQFIQNVEQALENLQISISQGFIITDPASPKSVAEYLMLADQRMYQMKRQHHQ
jgi:diguanylate cyclase (GGDEF)-like protein